MTATFDLISEQVLTSAASSVTFSSIPQGFKDLVLEVVARTNRSSLSDFIAVRFNGDTGSNYSMTYFAGDGLAASSGRNTNSSSVTSDAIPAANASSGVFGTFQMNLQSYASTSVFKTEISRSGHSAALVGAQVGLWRSTSAITSIVLFPLLGTTFDANSTFRLFGIVG